MSMCRFDFVYDAHRGEDRHVGGIKFCMPKISTGALYQGSTAYALFARGFGRGVAALKIHHYLFTMTETSFAMDERDVFHVPCPMSMLLHVSGFSVVLRRTTKNIQHGKESSV